MDWQNIPLFDWFLIVFFSIVVLSTALVFLWALIVVLFELICGRTVLYSHLQRHKNIFHSDSNGSLILDFL